VIGLFYYLRIVVKLYESSSGRETRIPAISPISMLPIAAAGALVIGVGIFPAQMLDLIRAATVIFNR
jgi:NADH:ubiquinone oxidoreductase subunit 2 (subunit N)